MAHHVLALDHGVGFLLLFPNHIFSPSPSRLLAFSYSSVGCLVRAGDGIPFPSLSHSLALLTPLSLPMPPPPSLPSVRSPLSSSFSPPLLPRASSPLPYPPSFLSPSLLPLPTPLCPFFVQATGCNSPVLNKVCWHLRGQNAVRVGRTGSCPLRWVRIMIPLCLQTLASRTQERDLNGH